MFWLLLVAVLVVRQIQDYMKLAVVVVQVD
jgi:hypothetical protein